MEYGQGDIKVPSKITSIQYPKTLGIGYGAKIHNTGNKLILVDHWFRNA
jgi:hypothetical protein